MAEAKESKPRKRQPEASYTKAEIMAASAQFAVSPDAMAGALRRVPKDSLTRAEAEKAVQEFQKRQV
ncbi:oligoribonuclease [Paenibacillus dendritiformis]|uniref:oligoribonuclease n=1 Tax=Paenibacillus dendritiformis TaxID=130049 RepID=UPI000DA79147|nr:oligoribonuclease [Paenibacillus dendritiformis]PZM67479.1 oligoribonuclease [Paenibacillus dendritiformis]